jgi:uncharacterized protein YbjQ (UPF0145 family)
MLIVNMETVPGYEIREVLGEVHGITARSRNAYYEGIKFLTGSSNPRVASALGRWRDEAIAQMSKLAYARGANAVVCMRFDHRDITASWTEICAYGTAVFVVPARPGNGEAAATAPVRGWAHVPTPAPATTD